MLKYNKTILKNILINEFNQNEAVAIDYSNSTKELNEKLQSTLDGWLRNRIIIDDIEVDGITMSFIIEKENRFFLDALNTMDVFLKNPEMVKIFKKLPKTYFQRT